MQDDDVRSRISAIIYILKCLKGRDAFMKAYEKEFAMRLLNNTSISTQWEEEFINELQVECGFHCTQKMTTMMKDINTSKEHLR